MNPDELAELHRLAHDEAAVDAALARLPAPRSPEILLEKLLALGVGAGDVVVDVGCGRAEHALQIAAATGCSVIGVDATPQQAAEARDRIAGSPAALVGVALAMAEALPLRAGSAGYVWCRDMLYSVDLPRTLRQCASVLRPGGWMVTYQSFATELLERGEAERFAALSLRWENMDPAYFERCAREAGFAIVERDVIGSEWREWWEADGSRRTSEKLVRAAQFLRGGEELRRAMGELMYDLALADCLWGVYQMIGKLRPVAYVLRRE